MTSAAVSWPAGDPAADAATLALGALWVLLPGALVLRAAGVRSPALLAGAAPVVGIGAFTVAAVATAPLPVPFTWWTALAVTAALAALAAAVAAAVRALAARRPAAPPPGAHPSAGAGGPGGRTARAVGAVLLVTAAAWAVHVFRAGLGSLAVPSQEHDSVTQSLVAARIARSGEAAPWTAQPLDVVTGSPALYYPSGLHEWVALLAGTSGAWGGTVVTALNATSVLVVALVQPLGLFALAHRVLPGAGAVAGGAAALASALAYQPLLAMHHDSGAVANAAALALAPGLLALVLPPPAAERPAPAARVLPLALGCAGALNVHPSAAVTVGAGAVAWVLADGLVRRRWPLPWRWAGALACGGALAAALVLPALAAAAGAGGGSSERFARDVPVLELPAALRRVLVLPLQGGIDPEGVTAQWWLAGAVLLGAVLAGRWAGAVALTWLAWAAVSVLYLVGASAPGLDVLWDTAWNSYYRVAAHGAPWAWLLVGVAAVRLPGLLARLVPPAPRAALSGALAVVLLAGTAAGTGDAVVRALREKHADPVYQRVSPDDLAAAAFLAERVGPGERVLNNGNDGSTWGYVRHGVPVLATTPIGSPRAPRVRELLRSFREFPTDARVRELVRELGVRWVVVDADAPWLPLGGADAAFYGSDSYTVPPGLTGLDEVPGLRPVFRSGTVTVYEVPELPAP
ncbi:DUF6541 family protein [Kineococcus sp. G2]|uniref:DUF6541 family protein n=1 Tax=Kineococcus sp. G2 TaxID=3127484 RepID=UPI00301CF715